MENHRNDDQFLSCWNPSGSQLELIVAKELENTVLVAKIEDLTQTIKKQAENNELGIEKGYMQTDCDSRVARNSTRTWLRWAWRTPSSPAQGWMVPP